ncbi:MAG: hypothetical protein KatS3mg131_1862 [Candidatus Tectimicrobiota bacterium]|nr:MAG: hypothetical protein KatS3mg131_1862 [Candidatus Tectomicrobia bacterium]
MTKRAREGVEALELLGTSLDLAEGAALFFVVTSPSREGVLQKKALYELLASRPIIEVRISPERPLALEAVQNRLSALLEQGARPVVLVEAEDLDLADVELSIQGAWAERVRWAQRVLQDLNLKREALARLGVPVLFLVTPATFRAFSVWAADLFSANSGVFELERPLIRAPEEEEPIEGPQAEAPRGLPEEEIRKRIRLYEEMLGREARQRTPQRALQASLAFELAKLYHSLGDLLRALEYQEKATALYRDLAHESPAAFLPRLAASLNNLSNCLSELGRHEEALRAIEEAVGLYRQLVQQRPTAFLPELAQSLGTYGRVLRALGRSGEAATAFAEGLRHLTPFSRRLPQAYGGLARALKAGYLAACQEAGRAPEQALLEEAG